MVQKAAGGFPPSASLLMSVWDQTHLTSSRAGPDLTPLLGPGQTVPPEAVPALGKRAAKSL